MTTQAVASSEQLEAGFRDDLPQQLKSEFNVADEYEYNRASPVRWILSHLLRYKGFMASFLLAAIITNILFSYLPVLTGQAFDLVLADDATASALIRIVFLMIGVVIARGIIDLTNALSIEVLGKRLERDARQELYTSLLGKSQTFHNRQRVGDIMARAANDVRQLNPMMNPGTSLIIESSMSTIAPIVFIGMIDWRLLLSPVLFVIALIFAIRNYVQKLTPVSGMMRGQFGTMNAGLTETIAGIEVVKSTAQEAQEQRKFVKDARRYRDLFVQQGEIQARYLPLLLLGIAFTAAFAHGLYLYSQSAITIGELVAYMGLMSVLRFPAFISIFTFALVQMGIAGAERILELMKEETELDENTDGHAEQIKGQLTFTDVTFRHESESEPQPAWGQSDENGAGPTPGGDPAPRPTLSRVSFTVEPGQTVAIVGQTGSGKSTLTKLVNRIYDVDEGQILVDGVDVRNWSMGSLRSQIATIEQDIFLFSRTIAENIGFGLGVEQDREAIIAAAKQAEAHDFIEGFADGYDTVIGERGVTLSGGQRQRLAIARALLTDPRILILDDSTSAIDSATEDKIQQAIDHVLDGRTTLLITHRLSQIRRADKILVLHHGEVVDQGSHEELISRNHIYQRIFSRYIEG